MIPRRYRIFRWELLLAVLGCLTLALSPDLPLRLQPLALAYTFSTLFAQVILSAACIGLGPGTFQRRLPPAVGWLVGLFVASLMWCLLKFGQNGILPTLLCFFGIFTLWLIAQLFVASLRFHYRAKLHRIPVTFRPQNISTGEQEAAGQIFAFGCVLVVAASGYYISEFWWSNPWRTPEIWTYWPLLLLMLAASSSCLVLASLTVALRPTPKVIFSWILVGLSLLLTLGELGCCKIFARENYYGNLPAPTLAVVAFANAVSVAWGLAYGLRLRWLGYRLEFAVSRQATKRLRQARFWRAYRHGIIGATIILFLGFVQLLLGFTSLSQLLPFFLGVFIAILFGVALPAVQITVASAWIVLGPCRGRYRVPLAVAWMGFLLYCLFHTVFSGAFYNLLSLGLLAFVAWCVPLSILGLIARRFSLSIQHLDEFGKVTARTDLPRNRWQFSIRQILVLTGAVALLLGIYRALDPRIPSVADLGNLLLQLGVFAVYLLILLATTVPLFLAVLAIRHGPKIFWITLAVLCPLVLVETGVVATLNGLFLRGSGVNFFYTLGTIVLTYVVLSVETIAIAWLFRRLGYRLTWPERKSNQSLTTAERGA